MFTVGTLCAAFLRKRQQRESALVRPDGERRVAGKEVSRETFTPALLSMGHITGSVDIINISSEKSWDSYRVDHASECEMSRQIFAVDEAGTCQ